MIGGHRIIRDDDVFSGRRAAFRTPASAASHTALGPMNDRVFIHVRLRLAQLSDIVNSHAVRPTPSAPDWIRRLARLRLQPLELPLPYRLSERDEVEIGKDDHEQSPDQRNLTQCG
jgi:hypothetical protein